MKQILTTIVLAVLPLAASGQADLYVHQQIFVCTPPAGSCAASVVRNGRDSVLVRYTEDCAVEKGVGNVRFGLFGLFDKKSDDEEWVSKEQIGERSRDCP